MRGIFLGIALIISILPKSNAFGIDTIAADSIQAQIIDSVIFNHSVILLDIRRADEVVKGIVASDHCKPYHLVWGSDEWLLRYKDLPKDSAIIVYCASGNRSGNAAKFLVDSGFTMVLSMSGGVSNYKGKLADSSNFKPWSDLPQPSYKYTAIKINALYHRAKNISTSDFKKQIFNLKGQRINSLVGDPTAPVFLLEQIGDNRKKRVVGFHRLLQNE